MLQLRAERRQDRLMVKFSEGALVDPQKLMGFVGSTPGAEFTPAGVLKFPVTGASDARLIAEVKQLLESLRG